MKAEDDKRDDGGAAFSMAGATDPRGEYVWGESGMTLRDYFAGKAMQARVTAAWSNPSPTNASFHAWEKEQPPDGDMSYSAYLALESYDYADAMLAARKK